MKILSYAEFKKLPAGTIFSYYQPCYFRGLHKKGETWEVDFIECDLIAPIDCNNSDEFVTQCEKAEKGEEIKLDFEYYGREGMFDEDQLYAVYSKEDIDGLIKALSG